MSNIKSLIDAISTGDSIGTEQSFNAAMAEKISAKLDTMRQDIAQNLFATEEVESVDEEVQELDELSAALLFRARQKAQNRADDASEKSQHKAAQVHKKQANVINVGLQKSMKKERDALEYSSLSAAKRRTMTKEETE